MKQTYGIIGNGRLARHLIHYFSLLGISFRHWHRGCDVSVNEALNSCSIILVLVKDQSISSFVSLFPDREVVHCSGSLILPGVQSVHPLMTLGLDLYDLEVYRQMPFILEEGKSSFSTLFPLLPNRHYYISPEDKKLYHALCVVAGNFTSIIWQKVFMEIKKIGLEKEIFFPYLRQTVENLCHNSDMALTGPIARNDGDTIRNNLSALESSNGMLFRLYQLILESENLA